MKWLTEYQLFLFDFDGLLVNSEEIHYKAYQMMCTARGFELPWSFSEYCFIAHYDSTKLKTTLYNAIPELHEMEPEWNVLYEEKKCAVLYLLNSGAVHLMPGAAALLNALKEKDILRCVVTNSPKEQIEIIKRQNPILNSIPAWFTRETYREPKPNPECYLNAIAKMGGEAKRIIGFEDTPRGLEALLKTPAKPVFISKVAYPEIPEFIKRGVFCYPSLDSLPLSG